MTVVQNVELDPQGRPAANVKIEVRVGGVPAATDSGTGSVVAVVNTVTDSTGQWSLNLIANSLLRPVGTWYTFRRTYPAALGGTRLEQYGVVPNQAAPVNFEDIIVSEPEAPRLTDSELTAHLANPNPHDVYLLKAEAATKYAPIGTTGGGGGGSSATTTSQITDFGTAVRAVQLDDFATPNAPVNLGGQQVKSVATGTADTDAINLAQLKAHEARQDDPHAAAGYAIMVGGGRREWVQDSEPTSSLVRQGDKWTTLGGVVRVRGASAWNAAATVTTSTPTADTPTTTPNNPTTSTDVDRLANLQLGINHFLTRTVASNGAARAFDENINKVTSGALALSMTAAVIKGDQTMFDKIRDFANTNMKRSIHSEARGPNLWANLYTIGTGVVDWSWESGAEYERVVSLSRAIQLWNRQKDIDELSAVAEDLKKYTLNFDEGRAYQTTDPYQQGAASGNGHHQANGGDVWEMNISYCNPLAYRLLKLFTGDSVWDQALAGFYDFLTKATNNAGGIPTSVGLPPDWADYTTAGHDANAITSGTNGWTYTRSTDYGSEAFRAIIHCAQDAMLFNESRAKTFLSGPFRDWALAQWSTTDKFTDKYTHTGTRTSTAQKLIFAYAAYFAIKVNDPANGTAATIKSTYLTNALVTDTSVDTAANQKYFRSVPTSATSTPSYYNEAWMIISEALENGVYAQLAAAPGITGKYKVTTAPASTGGTTTVIPTTSTPTGSVPLWTDPNSFAASYASALPAGTKKNRFTWLASVPQVFWTGPEWDGSASGLQQAVNDAKAKGQWIGVSVYGIPNRDLSGASAGGSAGAAQYRNWTNAVVAAIGTANAVVIIEPDSIAQMLQAVQNGQKSQADFDARMALIAEFVQKLRSGCPNARLYLDGAHAAWFSDPSALVPGMIKAGIANCHGICGNVSNFRTDSEQLPWMLNFVSKFNMPHLGVIWDTGRNGKNPAPDGSDWQGPLQTQFGKTPQYGGSLFGNSLVHGILWVKRPGESDGNDPNGGRGSHGGLAAGNFDPRYLWNDNATVDNQNGNSSGDLSQSGDARMLQRPPTPGVPF